MSTTVASTIVGATDSSIKNTDKDNYTFCGMQGTINESNNN